MNSQNSQAGRDCSRSRFLAPALIIAAVVATSALGGLATDPNSSWYRDLERPEWQPASSVFAPVWTLLYALIATSMIILWHRTDGQERKHLFVLWGANLVLNLAWTVIFFRGHSPSLPVWRSCFSRRPQSS